MEKLIKLAPPHLTERSHFWAHSEGLISSRDLLACLFSFLKGKSEKTALGEEHIDYLVPLVQM